MGTRILCKCRFFGIWGTCGIGIIFKCLVVVSKLVSGREPEYEDRSIMEVIRWFGNGAIAYCAGDTSVLGSGPPFIPMATSCSFIFELKGRRAFRL